MLFKYQLILLGSTGELSKQILELTLKKVEDLKLPSDSIKIIDRNNFKDSYKKNQPAYAIYFGDENGEFADENIVEELIEDNRMILPIFFEANSFDKHIPKALEAINGMLYDNNPEAIVNLVFESFELLRDTRKVFISYRRSKASSVAIQLYEALSKKKFDVFLDTHSIKSGENFQEELWHRMTDCDAIILLNTPDFFNSQWCKEEFAEAAAKQIALIQLIWPENEHNDTTEFSFPIRLNKESFENGIYTDNVRTKLKDELLANIIEQMESIRARNLAARQNNLISEFVNIAKECGKSLRLQPYQYLTEDRNGNSKRIFIPLVGIPQSINCDQSEKFMLKFCNFKIDEIYLIYDDIRIRNKWIKHLDWLNKQLRVKTLKKQEFESWLHKN